MEATYEPRAQARNTPHQPQDFSFTHTLAQSAQVQTPAQSLDALHWALIALFLTAAACALWMAFRWSSARAMHAGASARAEATQADLANTKLALAHRDTSLETLREKHNAFENRLIESEQELGHQQLRHTQELRTTQEHFAQRESHLASRERDLRERYEQDRAAMQTQFKAAADETLRAAREQLSQWAEQSLALQNQKATGDLEHRKLEVANMLGPIAQTLDRTDKKLAQLDKDRAATEASLQERCREVALSTSKLGEETRKLGNALRKPEVRGRYGEMQLRRVAELAGMVEYCDFSTQQSFLSGDQDAAQLRPDMIVNLPSGRSVVVDAKTNIQSYLDAIDAGTEEERERHLDKFAQHVADQAAKLSKKQYWASVPGSPEFVVMFIPGDQFLDAALARRPDALELASKQNIILASPATLIGLLRAIHVGYHEARLAQDAQALRELGKEFHERMATSLEHLAALAGNLESAVQHYNRFVGSYQTRLKPTLERFEASGVRGAKPLPKIDVVSGSTRALSVRNAEPIPRPPEFIPSSS